MKITQVAERLPSREHNQQWHLLLMITGAILGLWASWLKYESYIVWTIHRLLHIYWVIIKYTLSATHIMVKIYICPQWTSLTLSLSHTHTPPFTWLCCNFGECAKCNCALMPSSPLYFLPNTFILPHLHNTWTLILTYPPHSNRKDYFYMINIEQLW